MTDVIKPTIEERAGMRNVLQRSRDKWRRARRSDRIAETMTQGAWAPPGLVRRAWRKTVAIKNHPPGLDAFDAAAGVITLAILLWILAEMMTL